MALALFRVQHDDAVPCALLVIRCCLLLLISGAMVEALEATSARMAARSWLVSLTAIVALVLVTLRALISPFPSVVAASSPPANRCGRLRGERKRVGTDHFLVDRGQSSDDRPAAQLGRRHRSSSSTPNHSASAITRRSA